MSDIAKVSWNEKENRWELHIDGVFKAYTKQDPESNKSKHLVDLAESKGYRVELQE